ncbi:hypothetical protein CYLTODRAFT_8448 [Cylindrobasidium torrendii FP15055 ss-10]|uniref:Uncharacterized protein n=1 Tax=Cylindrobasidium torrendii FP15055 ss-10 TaxID=1314674 RepID=A0A0D7BRH4_9AGAR|nr:hypothetical protein CYLTODRAFT_8448 [Cylindrobasidium torrendii FP15055 ss-10]
MRHWGGRFSLRPREVLLPGLVPTRMRPTSSPSSFQRYAPIAVSDPTLLLIDELELSNFGPVHCNCYVQTVNLLVHPPEAGRLRLRTEIRLSLVGSLQATTEANVANWIGKNRRFF